jgi:putative FmdB family regulatory protein
MPIYEYRCDRGHTFEVMQRMTDDPLTSCTTCDASVQRVFHPVAVHFKGSGFYATDYGKKKSATSSEASGSSTDADKGESTKSEPKKGEGKKSEAKPASSDG